jgi:hypothetical protein
VIYIDEQLFGSDHILSAVGVDVQGEKHIRGVEPGATENAAAVKRLLMHLRDQGLPTDRKYLFIIDGAKALRGRGSRKPSAPSGPSSGAATTRSATSRMSCCRSSRARS